jgi:hypothetical protein
MASDAGGLPLIQKMLFMRLRLPQTIVAFAGDGANRTREAKLMTVLMIDVEGAKSPLRHLQRIPVQNHLIS